MINNDLTGTGGRVIGHTRNHENRHQPHRENRSSHVATITALLEIPVHDITACKNSNLVKLK